MLFRSGILELLHPEIRLCAENGHHLKDIKRDFICGPAAPQLEWHWQGTAHLICLHLCGGGVEMRPSKFSLTIFSSSNRHGVKESETLVAQWCPTLCDPMDCSLPGSSVHGILWARILVWVAISFSRRFSLPRDRTPVSCIAGRNERKHF